MDGSIVIVAIAIVIMHIDLSLRDRREYKRRKEEEAAQLKRIMEIMRDPEWRASWKQCFEAHKIDARNTDASVTHEESNAGA